MFSFPKSLCFHLSFSQQGRNGAGIEELFCTPSLPKLQNPSLKFLAQHPRLVPDLLPPRTTGASSTESSWFWYLGNPGLGMAFPPPEPFTLHSWGTSALSLLVLNPIFLFLGAEPPQRPRCDPGEPQGVPS